MKLIVISITGIRAKFEKVELWTDIRPFCDWYVEGILPESVFYFVLSFE